MAFSLSPGITVTETDLSGVIPAVSSTAGGIAGVFTWGPVDKIQLVQDEAELDKRFGKPSNFNAETWFSAAGFLDYSKELHVSRAADTSVVFNAIANTSAAPVASHVIKNEDHFTVVKDTLSANVQFVAKYPGELGNSLRIIQCDNADQHNKIYNIRSHSSNTSFDSANTKIAISVGSAVANVTLANTAALANNTPLPHATATAGLISIGDYIELGNSSIGKQMLKVKSVGAIRVANTTGTNTGYASFDVVFDDIFKLSTNFDSSSLNRKWEFFNTVKAAPGTSEFAASRGVSGDELHVVVIDQDGKVTGTPGKILEVFESVSRATDAKLSNGQGNFYKDVINTNSSYVWAISDRPTVVSNTAANIVASTATSVLTLDFVGGTNGSDESAVSIGTIASAYDKFKESEKIDISLLIAGKARGGVYGEQLANYLIDNIAEYRKDCVVFISPDKADVVNNTIDPAADVTDFFNAVRSSSYAVFDSGYKYRYDRYNDVYRWVPLNADIAGLCVNTDRVRDPWYSPAGFNRGFIKNVVKLAFNPSKTERDILYKARVNPVITAAGQGTVLYGDKTGLSKSSAFDRINVRRLFIVLEKAIARAAQSTLFEFNDEFTRAQFKNLVEPFLRDVQGRRGIYAFRVVCDRTNNTPEVIDSNTFIGDIYIQPAKSINEIRLNFIATRTDAVFEEISGQF